MVTGGNSRGLRETLSLDCVKRQPVSNNGIRSSSNPTHVCLIARLDFKVLLLLPFGFLGKKEISYIVSHRDEIAIRRKLIQKTNNKTPPAPLIIAAQKALCYL